MASGVRADENGAAGATRRTQAERSAESEERMLNAAEQLFAEQGFVRTTLVEIGRCAGYSGGLTTHRFGSKYGVLQRLFERYRTSVQDKYVDRDAGGTMQAITLADFLNRYFAIDDEEVPRRRALHVLMGESLGPLRDCAALFVDYNRWFASVVEDAVVESQRRGLVRADVDVKDLATMLIATLRGTMLLWHSDSKSFKLAALAESVKGQLRWAMTDKGLAELDGPQRKRRLRKLAA